MDDLCSWGATFYAVQKLDSKDHIVSPHSSKNVRLVIDVGERITENRYAKYSGDLYTDF